MNAVISRRYSSGQPNRKQSGFGREAKMSALYTTASDASVVASFDSSQSRWVVPSLVLAGVFGCSTGSA